MAATVGSFLNAFQNNIEEPVRIHLKNVYTCLTGSLMAATIGAYVDLNTDLLHNSLLTVLATIGLLFALQYTKNEGKNIQLRLALFLAFSFLTGLGLGPLLDLMIQINPQIILTALAGTTVVFVSFSIAALLARRGYWLFLGGTILSLLFGLSFFTLATMLFRSSAVLLYQAHLYLGLLLMSAFVLYDTQLIMEKRRAGDQDFLDHSVLLFIDFIGIFRRLLIILGQKEKSEQEKKKRS